MRIHAEVGQLKLDLNIMVTSAPESYDGFGTFTIARGGADYAGNRTPLRLVAIQDESLSWQSGRYASGLHSPVRYDEDALKNCAWGDPFYFSQSDVENILYKRLLREDLT